MQEAGRAANATRHYARADCATPGKPPSSRVRAEHALGERELNEDRGEMPTDFGGQVLLFVLRYSAARRTEDD